MTAPQVEVRTVERAIRCANGHVHYGEEFFAAGQDAAFLLNIADHVGRPYMASDLLRKCGPHSYSERERIVTAWADKQVAS